MKKCILPAPLFELKFDSQTDRDHAVCIWTHLHLSAFWHAEQRKQHQTSDKTQRHGEVAEVNSVNEIANGWCVGDGRCWRGDWGGNGGNG